MSEPNPHDYWHPRFTPLELFAAFCGLSGHIGHGLRSDTKGWNRGFFCYPQARKAFMEDPTAWGRGHWDQKLQEYKA